MKERVSPLDVDNTSFNLRMKILLALLIYTYSPEEVMPPACPLYRVPSSFSRKTTLSFPSSIA